MNLVIDIGNSKTKYAVFSKHKMIDFLESSDSSKKDIEYLINRNPQIRHCIISTVQNTPPEVMDFLSRSSIQTILLNHETSIPFKNTYETPETLGNDRIAAIAGACYLYPDKNVLIIDAGTAITFDLINEKNTYLGGTISPGLDMRFKALHHFTAKLPYLKKSNSTKTMGKNTTEAIVNGVQNGMIFEIEGYLTKIGNKNPQLVVLLTGGDSQFFDNILKKPIFAVSNLTLVGLNFILEYNAQTL